MAGPAGDHRVLLLSSRETKRWVIPKGWPMRGKHLHEAAALEALEEGGLKGHIEEEPLGHYHYFKRRKDGTYMPAVFRFSRFRSWIVCLTIVRQASASCAGSRGRKLPNWWMRPELQRLIRSFAPVI